jgi:hypothetical protein
VGITFSHLAFSYWIDYLGFLLRKSLLLYSSHLALGVFQLAGNLLGFIKLFLAPLPGRKKTSARGVSHTHPLLCFNFCFTLFLLASFYQKPKKIRILDSCFYLSAFRFVKMATPENTKLCDFTSTNNSDFICTPIAPPAPAGNFYEIKPAL